MLPHSSFGIRVRKKQSKGFWVTDKGTKTHKKPQRDDLPDEGKVEGVSDTFKHLLRGK